MSNIFRLVVLALISITAGTSTAPAEDKEEGQQVFAACAACHAPDKNGVDIEVPAGGTVEKDFELEAK